MKTSRVLLFALAISTLIFGASGLADPPNQPLTWRPPWTVAQYRAAIRHPLSRTLIPTVPGNLDSMTGDQLRALIRGVAGDMCHQVPHDALVSNMRLLGIAENIPETALRTANDAFNRGNVFIGNSTVNRAAGAADGAHAIVNHAQARQAISEMIDAHPTVPRTAAAARLGPVAERQLGRFGGIRTRLGYNHNGMTVWERWGGVAQRGTRVLGAAGTAVFVWNLGSAAAAGDVPEARRVIGGLVPVIGELAADRITECEDYTLREYDRMISDFQRQTLIDTFGRRAVEQAEGGRRLPSPDGRTTIVVSGPGLSAVPESLWIQYGQAVSNRRPDLAEIRLRQIRDVCSRPPGGGDWDP